MKERPIIFNAEMVRAILDGKKTQTRRVIKPQPTTVQEFDAYGYPGVKFLEWSNKKWQTDCERLGAHIDIAEYCPYGTSGDHLWVRETWQQVGHSSTQAQIVYKADGKYSNNYYWFDSDRRAIDVHWKPSILMPQWASRILLEIEDVRVERVQTISHKDALAEGITDEPCRGDLISGSFAITKLAKLWNKINAKRGFGWNTNPWVWVIEFKVLTWQCKAIPSLRRILATTPNTM